MSDPAGQPKIVVNCHAEPISKGQIDQIIYALNLLYEEIERREENDN